MWADVVVLLHPSYRRSAGGRRWWAHRAFTRVNIGPIIQKDQIEDLMNVRGCVEKAFLNLRSQIVVTPPKAEAQ